jgi:hypothetical protein
VNTTEGNYLDYSIYKFGLVAYLDRDRQIERSTRDIFKY